MASFFLKPDGLLIAMKGPDFQAELDEAQAVLKSTGMTPAAIRDVRLPGTDLTRKIVTYNRVSG
jgi:hypothetical protein